MLLVAFVPSSTQQNGTYDPWLDYNDDGIIDAVDLQLLGQAYGTSGDPTKNITITGHATKLIKLAESVAVPPSSKWYSALTWIDGYSKVTVLIRQDVPASNTLSVFAYDYTGLAGAEWLVEEIRDFGANCVKTYDVMNQQTRIVYENRYAGTITIDAELYVMA